MFVQVNKNLKSDTDSLFKDQALREICREILLLFSPFSGSTDPEG